jgi:uncharacterized repeat protein (TIGR01451 family)
MTLAIMGIAMRRVIVSLLGKVTRQVGVCGTALAAALMLAPPAAATPFTITVPGTNIQIPGNYPEAGGIVLVLQGANGNFYFQISNPSDMMRGFQDRNTTVPQNFRGQPDWQVAEEYTVDCGVSSCADYFGGGIVAGWVRFTAQDGDTSPTGGGNFDLNDIELLLADTPNTTAANGPVDFSGASVIGNWSDPATETTNLAGTIATANRIGFPNGAFNTGWFDITDQSVLNSFLLPGRIVRWGARDADPNDNFWDFTLGNDADTSVVPERVAPGLNFTKTAVTSNFQAIGDTVQYTFLVENIGTVFIENITISDDQIANVTCPQTRLDPAESMTCTATDIVTQADLDAGGITNTATVIGTPQAGSLGPVEDMAFVPAINQTSSFVLVKADPTNSDADGSGTISVGDVLTYTITATNTGTLTQTNLSMTDPLISPSNVSCASVAPGGTCVLTGSLTVTQAQVDAGQIANTAQATSDALPAPQPASVTTMIDQTNGLSIDKRGVTASYNAAGDVLSYEYVVTNLGNVTITSPISVTDDRIASVNCPALPAGGLGPNRVLTCTATYTVTQADVDTGSVTNVATASDGTTTSPSDTVTINAVQTAGLEMTKVATPQDFSAVGDVISYTYTVTNTGNVTVTSAVSVSDNQISVSCDPLPAGGLAPLAALTCTATDTITQADIDAGSLTNTATATDGTTSSAPISETVTAMQTSALELTKTATPDTFSAVGDAISYEYVITNSGNTTITDVLTISDDRIATVSCPSLPAGGLLPLATLTCTGQDTVTQADIDAGTVTNTATVSDGTTTSAPVMETVTADQTPELTTTKSADANAVSSPAAVGDIITYTITSENTGNVSLTNVTVSDALLGGDVTSDCVFPATSGELAVGEMVSCEVDYTLTQADLDAGSVENTASASGEGPDGTEISDPIDAPVETPLQQAPGFDVVKTATAFDFTRPGDTATYEYVVTNNGNVTITQPISVTDNLIASVSCPALPAGGLAPTGSITCAGTYTVTQADLDNGSVTNLASATDGTTTSPLTSATIPASQNPGFSLSKTSPDTSFMAVGDVLTYTFTLANTGNLTLTGDFEVTDDRIGTFVCFSGNIVPGGSESCQRTDTVTLADLDGGSVTNQAFATNGGLTTVPVSVTVEADQQPAFTLDKRSLNGSFSSVSDTLSYEYEIVNTGNVTINGIALTDDRIGTISCPQTSLAPLGQMICTATDTVTQDDIDAGSVTNVADLTGIPSGGVLAPQTDTVTVSANQSPALDFDKTVLNADFSTVGETLSYQYRVENTGNVTVDNIVVSDDRIASVSCPQTSLAPGEFVVCTATDTVTQADIDAGSVTNIAMLSGDPAGGTLTGRTDQATVNADQAPSLDMLKEVGQTDFSAVGDTLSYTYTVTNTGNVTLTGPVSVSDDRIASVSCPALPAGGFLPGGVLVCTATDTVTQADLDAGSVSNTASASANGTSSAPQTVTVTGTQTPGIEVVKTAVTADFDAVGDFVDYEYVVTNTGNVTLMSAVTVSDDLISVVNCPTADQLAPGASVTCTARYWVTQADIDAGSVTNMASASAGGATAPTVSETVGAVQNPALTLDKGASPAVFNMAGDVISYTYTVLNSGNVTVIDPVVISDDRIAAVSCPALPAGGLAPGASLICSATDTATQADVDAGFITNTASATAGGVSSPQVDETVTADQVRALETVKTPLSVDFTTPGDLAVYEYAVTNTGNVTVTTPITVTDNLIPSVTCPASPAEGLLPGATLTCSGTYAVTQADLDRGRVTNIASASDGTTQSPPTSATIPANATPSVVATKRAIQSNYDAAGDILTYEFTVRNNGNITLTGTTNVEDDQIGTIACFTGNLVPGETAICQADYTVTQADVDAGSVTNVAFAQNGILSSGVVDVTVEALQMPEISLAKTALDTAYANPGDTLNYEYIVTNSGNTSIVLPVSISDDRIGSVACPALPAGGLLPGQTLVCTGSDTVTQADIDAGNVTNTATATDGVIVSDPVSETVTATQTRQIDMVKTALDTNFAAPGDVLTYSYLFTNTGNTTLQGALSLSDDRISNVACPPVPAGGLVPGGQLTCSGEEIVTQALIDGGSVTNTATGTLGSTSSAPDTASVAADLRPELTVVKTADNSALSDPVVAGNVLTYTIVASNSGNVTLSNVQVVDNLLGGDITASCSFAGTSGMLAVGAQAICVADYTITQTDVDAGGIMNSASANAQDTAGTPVSDVSDSGSPSVETPALDGSTDGDPTNDPTVTFFGPAPSLAIQKTALTADFTAVGDVLSYEYTVTNTGNVTLIDPVTISDDRISNVVCPALASGGLAPNAQLVCTGEDSVSQADLDAGQVTNIASASSGGTQSPETSATIGAVQAAAFAIEKTAGPPVQVGGPLYDVVYTINVTNTGNVTQTDLVILDDLAAAFAPATVSGLPTLSQNGFSGSGGLNGNYDGVTDIGLLAGGVELAAGARATLSIEVQLDISTGTPAGGNTAIGTSAQTPTPVPSDDPTETPDNASDTNPTVIEIVDTDGDGVPDGAESSSDDRDGDGIPDAEDYDPTGYFYCEESGAILSGGAISISGPAGSNSAIGTQNNITIVEDGSNGFYQFFVSAPGRYTLTPTYPVTGEPSEARVASTDPLDVTTALPANPALLGATELGSTGQLADFSEPVNAPFFLTFDIEPGDPTIFANNIPLQSCGTPNVALEKTIIGEAERQPDGRVQAMFELTATNTGQTILEDVIIEDNLAAVFGTGAAEPVSVDIIEAPANFAAAVAADFDGETSIATMTDGGVLEPGESVTTQLLLNVQIDEAGEYVNTAVVTAWPPLTDTPGLVAPNGGNAVTASSDASLEITAIGDPSQLVVTKTARPSVVQIGDLVRYRITVRNDSTSAMSDLRVIDRPPAGLAYVPESSVFSTENGESLVLEPEISSGQLAWTLDTQNAPGFDVLEAGETLTLDLSMLPSPSAGFGELTNTAFVQDALTGVTSDLATAVVEFIPEPTFDCTPVIGRVYEDVNANGYPDGGEPGIPGARLITVNGDIITTDEHGRYHIPCAIVPDNERGSNFILKTDIRSLPLGYAMTTQNPRVVRATRGKFIKMNFGAVHKDAQRIDLSASDFDERGALIARSSVIDSGVLSNARLLVVYHARGEESVADARKALEVARKEYSGFASDVAFEIVYDRSENEDGEVTPASPYEGPRIGAPRIEGRVHNYEDGKEEDYLLRDGAGLVGPLADIAARSNVRTYREAPSVETTVDALHIEKQLSLSTELVSNEEGERLLYVHGFWNYGHWIEAAEVRVFSEADSVRGTPLMTVELDEFGAAVLPVEHLAPDNFSEAGLAVVLRVYDEKGRFDETRPRLAQLIEADALPSADEAGDDEFAAFGADAISFSNIPVNGATVRVYGRNVTGETAEVFGQVVRVDADGKFVAEAILPDGRQTVDVTTSGQRVIRDIDVKTRDFEGVGLFEATLGQRQTDNGVVTVEGRAAFYVRGRLSPRIRVTATADTGEAGLDDLFDQFDERDSRSLLRRLDPDKFYPVYGDGSTIEEDAPTSGRFYVRVERDDDYVIWGNYRTNFNDTEFARVDRTLYGAKLHWDANGNPTRLGDARATFDAFLSDPGTQSSRDELRGTGGSVYFLRNADISIGTDIVRVETRDVISGIVQESRLLVYGEDYDIDYIQGRIILNSPLNSTADDGRLFTDGNFSGNEVFLVVEYEFTGNLGEFDQVAFGGRGTRWFGDYVKLGGTYARDVQNGEETDIYGADLTLQATGDTFLRAEFALTDGAGLSTFRSLDGGLTFVQQALPGGTQDPLAFLVEGRASLADLGLGDGALAAYYRNREAGFAGFGEQTTTNTTQYGASLDAKLNARTDLAAQLDVIEGGFGGERTVGEVALTAQVSEHISVQTGVSYQDDTQFDDSVALAARLQYNVDETNLAYVFAQGGLTGSDNAALTDRVGVGAQIRLNEKLTAGAEVSSGAAGLGSQVNVRYAQSEHSETYLTYDLPTRSNTGQRTGGLSNVDGGITLGARRRLIDGLSVFGEERRRFGSTETGFGGTTHAYGVDYSPAEAWTFGVAGEFGQVGPFDRQAVSLNGGFQQGAISVGAAAEFRFDDNAETGEELDAYLLRVNAQAQITEGLQVQGKVNYADADGSTNGGVLNFQAAKFTEASLAAAFRPVAHDRLNVLAKLVYLEDLSPAGQRINGDLLDFRQRSTIASIDATYQVSDRCSVGGKYGYRSGEVTEGRDSTDFFSSQAWLGIGRIDCNIVNKWDGLLEGRYLDIGDGTVERWGGLVGVYRNLGNNVKLGGGLTWGGVNDDVLALSPERDIGWYLNVVTKF